MIVVTLAITGLPFLTVWVDISPVFHHSQTEGKLTKEVHHEFCNI